MFTKSL